MSSFVKLWSKYDLKKECFWISDEFTIIFRFEVKANSQPVTKARNNQIISNEPPHFLAELLETGLHSDVLFDVDGKEFKAHRGILALRCEYFKKMFESGFVEATSDKIPINDVEAQVFEVILKFIYTNKVPVDHTGDMTQEILLAAKKFELEYLAQFAGQKLLADNSLDNYFGLLSID